MNSPANQPQSDYDVIVVGGAAAGLTAALYAARRTLKTLVITKSLGGQAALTPSIENYPGIKKTGGIELMMQFQEHAQEYGAEFVYETVAGVTKNEDLFSVQTHQKTRTARSVILAFGLTPKNLDVPGEQEFQGKGVTYCATCDAPLFKGRSTAVVGGTYEALDAALLLARLECSVTLIHTKSGYPTYPHLFQRAQEDPRIQLRMNTTVVRIEGKEAVETLVVRGEDGNEEALAVNGVFVENGHKIDSAWLGELVEFAKGGSVVVDAFQETKTPGLFAAGDVTPQRDKQVVISAGAGATAALSAYYYIQKQIGKPASRVDWAHTAEV